MGPSPRRADTRPPATPLVTKKKLLFTTTTIVLSLVLAVAVAELMLRMSGRHPWPTHGYYPGSVTTPDAILGWRNKIGSFQFPDPANPAASIHVTMRSDGGRAAGMDLVNGLGDVLFLGCSVTHGVAVTDEDTFVWMLQKRMRPLELSNHGVLGYGTYQCLLLMEQLLSSTRPCPRVIVYGMINHHQERNVATAAWLRQLSENSSRPVELPYCDVASTGQLRRWPPTAYPDWPFKRSSAIIASAEALQVSLRARPREVQQRRVTELLLLQMDQVARSRGSSLLVALLELGEDDRQHYMKFMEEAHIAAADCVSGRFYGQDTYVVGDGHPNRIMNGIWAGCLEAKLRAAMTVQRSGPGLPDRFPEQGDPSGP